MLLWDRRREKEKKEERWCWLTNDDFVVQREYFMSKRSEMPRRSWAVRSMVWDRRICRRSSVERRWDRCVTKKTIKRNGTIAEEDRRHDQAKRDGSGREFKERESGQRLGNNRPRRKIHENLFLISWPIAVYIYAQYERARVILLAIWSDREDSSAFLVRPAKKCDWCPFRRNDLTSRFENAIIILEN